MQQLYEKKVCSKIKVYLLKHLNIFLVERWNLPKIFLKMQTIMQFQLLFCKSKSILMRYFCVENMSPIKKLFLVIFGIIFEVLDGRTKCLSVHPKIYWKIWHEPYDVRVSVIYVKEWNRKTRTHFFQFGSFSCSGCS